MSTPLPHDATQSDRTPLAFWILGALLVCYVGACTLQRDNAGDADAWEHHRVLRALTLDLRHPGNPTFAVDVPSVRYSPYFVFQAVIARWTGIDPYQTLSAAAVVNTAFLILAIWAFLASFDEKGSALWVLIAAVGLYWNAPGYANSLALADLPWLQVNPSAWSFAWIVWSWAIFKRSLDRGRPAIWLALPLAMCLLDHSMTAFLGFIGLGVIALTRPPGRRWVWMTSVVAMAALTIGIAAWWPWFPVMNAILRPSPDRDYWFNGGILRLSLCEWCVPAYLGGLAALTRLDRDFVRTSLGAGALATLLGISSFVTRSPVLARLPVAATFLFAAATGVYLHRSGAMSLRVWRERLNFLRADRRIAPEAALSLAILLLLAYGLVPQGIAVLREPILGRAYVAALLHRPDKQGHVKETYDRLLANVANSDVVLSDVHTSWPVPSSNGKIVAALHYEFFVTDQAIRIADVERFFSRSESDADRVAILDKYHTRWILLNRRLLDSDVFAQLLDPGAVVSRERDLVLMDAKTWRNSKSMRATASRPTSAEPLK